MDRLERIAELKRQADQGRERIRQREEERERNPNAMQEHLLADARITKNPTDYCFSDPIGELPVSKTDEPAIIYRRYDGNASAPAPEPEPEPSDDDDEFADAFDRFSEATADALVDDARRIAELERANAELKGRVDMLVELIGQKKLWKP